MTTDLPPQKLPPGEIAFRTGVIIIALLAVLLSGLLFFLALNGEVRWQRGPLTGDRVFVIMAADERGIAWDNATTYRDPANPSLTCVRTTVRYFMWQGAENADNAQYCECYDTSTGRPVYQGPATCP